MKMPEPVNHRKIAVAEAFGLEANDVPEDGFDEEGFTVLADRVSKLVIPAEIQYLYASNEYPKAKILWPSDEWQAKGLAARDEDFAEGIGSAAYEQLQHMESQATRATSS